MTTKRKHSLDTQAPALKDSSILDETASPRSKRVRKSKVLSDDFVVYGTTSNNSTATYFRSKLNTDEDDASDFSSQDRSQPEVVERVDALAAMPDIDRVLNGPEVIVVLERLKEELIEQWCNPVPVKQEKRGRGRPPKNSKISKPQVPVIRTKQKLIRIIKDGRTKVIQPLDKRERLAVVAKPPESVKKVPANIAPPKKMPFRPRLKAGAKFRAAAPSPKPTAGPSSSKKEDKSIKKDDKEDKTTKKKEEKGGKKEKEDAPPLLKVSGKDKDKDEEYVLCMNEDGQLLYVPTNVAMTSSTGSVRAQVTLPTDEEKTEKDEKGERKEASPVKKAPTKKESKKTATKKKEEPPVTDIMIGPSKEDSPVVDVKKKSDLPKSTTKKATKKLVPEGKGGKNAKGQDFVLCYNKVEDEYVYISRDLIKPKKDEALKKDGAAPAAPKGKAQPSPASAKKPTAGKVDKPKAKIIDVAKKIVAKKPEPAKRIVTKPDPQKAKAELADDVFNTRPMKPAILPVKKVTSQYLKPPLVVKKPLVFTQHYITPREVSRSAQGTVLLDPTTDEVIMVNNKPEQAPNPLTDATAALLKIGQGLQHDLAGKAEEQPSTDDNDWINVFINGSQASEPEPEPTQNVVPLQTEREPVVPAPVTSATETAMSSQEVIYEGSGLTDGQILTTVDGQYVVTSTDQTIAEHPQEQFIMAQDSQVVVTTTSASDPVPSVAYEEPQQTLEEEKEEAADGEVVYEQQAEIMQEAAGEIVYEQPQDQVVYEQDPAQEVVYEQPQDEEQQQEVVYEQPQDDQQVQQQEVVYEQPQEEQQQQEVVYEQPQEGQQEVIYEQPQEVYENGMQPQDAQIDYSQVAQQMGEPQTIIEQPQLDYTGITESPALASTPKAKSRAIIVVGDTSYVVESDTPIVQNGTIDQNVLSALMNSNRQAKQSKQQQRTLFTHQSHMKGSASSTSSPSSSSSSLAPSSSATGRSLLRTNLLPTKQTVVGDLGSLQGLLPSPSPSSLS